MMTHRRFYVAGKIDKSWGVVDEADIGVLFPGRRFVFFRATGELTTPARWKWLLAGSEVDKPEIYDDQHTRMTFDDISKVIAGSKNLPHPGVSQLMEVASEFTVVDGFLVVWN